MQVLGVQARDDQPPQALPVVALRREDARDAHLVEHDLLVAPAAEAPGRSRRITLIASAFSTTTTRLRATSTR